MSDWVLEITEGGERRSVALAPGLTRVGGAGCEVTLARGGADQLHLWDSPAKLVFVGKGERPRVAGRGVDELALVAGEPIEWLGALLCLRHAAPEPLLAEIPLPAAEALPDERSWRHVRAGLLFELGLVERASARRWQEAVVRGEFDPDACARDLLLASQTAPGDPRLLERSGRLLRDLLMVPYQRGLKGAVRATRGAARHGLAFVVVEVLILLLFSVLFAGLLVVLRLRWGWSVDGFLDGLIERLAW